MALDPSVVLLYRVGPLGDPPLKSSTAPWIAGDNKEVHANVIHPVTVYMRGHIKGHIGIS